MAGVVLADSFSAAESVAKSRVCDRRRSEASFSSRRGRRQISLVLYCSRATLRVALDGDASPAAAGSRLLVSSSTDATSQRPGCRALISAWRRIVIPPVGSLSTVAGLVLLSSRVEESLDALRHLATLFALKLVQLFCCHLGSSYVFCGRVVDRAICPE